MPTNQLICPLCRYETALSRFRSLENARLKCPCCRSSFADPHTFGAKMTYADCDSLQPVTRFPFALNGTAAAIHVDEKHMALVVGMDGRQFWLDGQDVIINDMPSGFQLYYVCLTPWISWGTNLPNGMGAYGRAQLSLRPDVIRTQFGTQDALSGLTEHLRTLLCEHATAFVKQQTAARNLPLLEQKSGYEGMLGSLADGVSVIRTDALGYRSANGYSRAFPPQLLQDDDADTANHLSHAPVLFLQPAKKPYTIKPGIEDVFCTSHGKFYRHKAGEEITPEALEDLHRVFRFSAKEFTFPNGWGLYNLSGVGTGYCSAHGTISFYVDSTEKLCALLARTKSWDEFVENFFTNVLRQTLVSSLPALIQSRIPQTDIVPERIGVHLSSLSIALTDVLNGEGREHTRPAFRDNGLRVSRIDILHLDFYSSRR